MLKCDRCGLRFDEWSADKRLAVLGDGYPMGTLIAVCPQCGCDDIDVVYDDEEDDDMSVSLWAWHEACDRHACVGDCDNCNYADEEAEDENENTK